MTVLVLIYIALQLADGYTTYRILSKGGREVNPVISKLIDWLDIVPALVVTKGAFIALGIYCYAEPDGHYVLIPLNVWYGLWVLHNLQQLNFNKE